MLGSTLGVKDGSKTTQVAMTSFGETSSNEAFFTGKPMIGELGYAFLFRNYRADNGKWQTADPIALASNTPQQHHIHNDLASSLGYPDGLNNTAYCNNTVINACDPLGLIKVGEGYKEDDVYYELIGFKYIGTYAILDSYSATELKWTNVFDLCVPQYRYTCTKSGCKNPSGIIDGAGNVAGNYYSSPGSKKGVFSIGDLGLSGVEKLPSSPSINPLDKFYFLGTTSGTHHRPSETATKAVKHVCE